MLEQQEAQDRINIDQSIHAQSDQINSETQGSEENMQKRTAMQTAQTQQNIMQEDNQGG